MNSIITGFPPVTRFDLCDPTAVKEAEFQSTAKIIVQGLYDDFKIIPFHPKISYSGTNWTPDFAIFDKNHGFWYIVEVEISAHHFEKHVLPQVEAFVFGDYGSDAASQIAAGLNISKSVAQTILTHVPREIIVISNQQNQKWSDRLFSIGVRHIVIETYQCKTSGRTTFRLDGQFIPTKRSLGFGIVKATDKAIKVLAGEFWKVGSYRILGPAGASEWECLVEKEYAWLMKKAGLIEFREGEYVHFILDVSGALSVFIPYRPI